jgi:hypothetical protein
MNSKKLRIWKQTVVTDTFLGLDIVYSNCDFVVSLGYSRQMLRPLPWFPRRYSNPPVLRHITIE